MDFILVVVGLIGFSVLAVLFGRDRRDEVIAKEHALALLGMTWDGQPGRPTRHATAHATQTVRQRVAGGLYRLADWLEPSQSEMTPGREPSWR